MNKTHTKGFLFVICTVMVLLLCPVFAIPAQAANLPLPVSAPEGETIEPRAPIIEWVFKEENGKKYRRLYNFTTGEWIGEWILCD